jgi:hypothetical protein
MTSEAPVTAVNGPTPDHLELSFLMPRSIFTNVHIHLTFFATSTLVFLTTTATGDSHAAAKPMGSLVYGMPDVCMIPRATPESHLQYGIKPSKMSRHTGHEASVGQISLLPMLRRLVRGLFATPGSRYISPGNPALRGSDVNFDGHGTWKKKITPYRSLH